ncbi:hypothetical protein [Pseudomonas nitroreducens]|uniref:hypothetical protein n=1 Tax=Pseudomonas nitroreducens TaxID=46680 RepID=UPI0026583E49|nr:hypothetical protein [Pseudomonas nitroreducens]MCP1647305.1 hypothetical protein [Pseudomonas nitroreducens]MCP1685881.1 hypothetical protein [Pseudomonas nitroreducens]
MTDSPLAQWRRLIDDRRQWKLTPDYHRAELEGLARKALELRLIDQGEFVEMCEIADAGRLTVLEDLAHQAFQRTVLYDVVAEGTGELLGEILSGTFMSVPPEPRGILGRVTYNEHGQLAMFSGSPAAWMGDVCGLTWTRSDGQQALLVETGRIVAGKVVRAITDADAFRVALDAHQVAREESSSEFEKKMALMIELAQFRVCPECRNKFSKRESCGACAGRGFTPKPDTLG